MYFPLNAVTINTMTIITKNYAILDLFGKYYLLFHSNLLVLVTTKS